MEVRIARAELGMVSSGVDASRGEGSIVAWSGSGESSDPDQAADDGATGATGRLIAGVRHADSVLTGR